MFSAFIRGEKIHRKFQATVVQDVFNHERHSWVLILIKINVSFYVALTMVYTSTRIRSNLLNENRSYVAFIQVANRNSELSLAICLIIFSRIYNLLLTTLLIENTCCFEFIYYCFVCIAILMWRRDSHSTHINMSRVCCLPNIFFFILWIHF